MTVRRLPWAALHRLPKEDKPTVWPGDSTADEDDTLIDEVLDDAEVLECHPLVPMLPRHFLILEDASWVGIRAD